MTLAKRSVLTLNDINANKKEYDVYVLYGSGPVIAHFAEAKDVVFGKLLLVDYRRREYLQKRFPHAYIPDNDFGGNPYIAVKAKSAVKFSCADKFNASDNHMQIMKFIAQKSLEKLLPQEPPF